MLYLGQAQDCLGKQETMQEALLKQVQMLPMVSGGHTCMTVSTKLFHKCTRATGNKTHF